MQLLILWQRKCAQQTVVRVAGMGRSHLQTLGIGNGYNLGVLGINIRSWNDLEIDKHIQGVVAIGRTNL